MLTIDTSHDKLGFSFFNVHMTIKMLHQLSTQHQAHLMFPPGYLQKYLQSSRFLPLPW